MQITSAAYLCFLFVSLILYYILPKRFQWVILLISGMVFFLSYGNMWLVIYPVAASLLAYISGLGMVKNLSSDKKKRCWMLVGILGDLLLLVALKYLNFPIYTINGIRLLKGNETALLGTISVLVPLGISFYTLSLIEYIRNVYYGVEPAENNYFKLLLFTTFFPCIISGPINKYSLFRPQIDSVHVFDYDRICFGAQRILWGFFKVLVISKRLEVLVNTIYADTSTYNGIYVVLAALSFTLQLYTNFSGSIDIVIGTAECFDIKLEENFSQPFFSKSIQEFWRRWHITLGGWMRDFVFYPVLRTRFMTELLEKLKGRYGKKKAKRLVNTLAMLILWFVVGMWHGGAWHYIIGSGLLHWLFITCEEIIDERKKNRLKKDDSPKGDSTSEKRIGVAVADILRMMRTYILVSASFIFFASDNLINAGLAYNNMFAVFNPVILCDGSLLELGLELKDYLILLVSVPILILVSVLREKFDVRKKIAGMNIIPRWIIYIGLLFFVILMGSYGPGYSATEFIYQGF